MNSSRHLITKSKKSKKSKNSIKILFEASPESSNRDLNMKKKVSTHNKVMPFSEEQLAQLGLIFNAGKQHSALEKVSR